MSSIAQLVRVTSSLVRVTSIRTAMNMTPNMFAQIRDAMSAFPQRPVPSGIPPPPSSAPRIEPWTVFLYHDLHNRDTTRGPALSIQRFRNDMWVIVLGGRGNQRIIVVHKGLYKTNHAVSCCFTNLFTILLLYFHKIQAYMYFTCSYFL